jgi:uncharacterized iron-regulated membrane protein
MSGIKRAALVFGVVALLLFADGLYLVAAHKNPNGDTGTLFGNPHKFLSSGTIVLISAVFVLAVSAGMWVAGVWLDDKERERKVREARERPPAGEPPTSEQPGPSGRTASAA